MEKINNKRVGSNLLKQYEEKLEKIKSKRYGNNASDSEEEEEGDEDEEIDLEEDSDLEDIEDYLSETDLQDGLEILSGDDEDEEGDGDVRFLSFSVC